MTINKNITPYNRWEGRFGNSVEWIVIHYTAGYNDTAKGNADRSASQYWGSSAHFFVDDYSVWQSVETYDTAWHCGDNASKNGCTNPNSIGIEMCSKYDPYPDMTHINIGSDYTDPQTGKRGVYWISDATANNTVWLVEELLKQFPTAKLCRHYDVTGKRCPMPWVDHKNLWTNFLNQVEENKPMTDAEKKAFKALQDEVALLKKENKELSSKVTSLGKVDTAINKRVSVVESHTLPKYHKIDDAPNWLKPTLKKLVSKGYLKGTDKDDLAISYDEARLLTINDRAGDYDL